MINELNFGRKNRLPIILQAEATECGLACLTMVAKFYGHDVDLNGMRARHPVSLKGANLEALINLSDQLDLGSRALRVDLEAIGKLQLPAILHWDLQHFVVLKSVKGNNITIHDPARGERVMSLNEASDHFTGVALELLPTTSFKKIKARITMKLSSLWGRLIGLKRAIFQTLLLSFILQAIVLASPFYLQLVVDEAVTGFDMRLLLVLALGFGALAIINTVTAMMRSWTILYFGNQMSFQMVANVFRHLMHLPTAYFEKRHVGDIMSRMRSTGPIQTALTQSLVAAIIDGFMAIITGVVIFMYSPILGTIVVVSVLLLLLVTIGFYPALHKRQEEAILTEAIKDSYEIESIRASTTIKLFSSQSQRVSSWRNLFANTINANVSYGKYQIFFTAAKDVITGLQTIIVVYFGAMLILKNEVGFTIGMLFAFMSFRQSFTQSVTSLVDKIIEFRLLGLHLERIADIAQAETETIIAPESHSEFSDDKPLKIEFREVRFRYSENDPWVLNGVNLTIEAGDLVAITGSSGGGKTTLLKLMLGLYMPTEGQILIDDQPLTLANQISWRKKLGVVMQDDQLLAGTLAENISFFDPEMSMERVTGSAIFAQIHDEIAAMPMNYFSFTGDMGSVLSGGQKQRILLARVLYRNPSMVFLDEGTANIDEATEKLIVEVISKMAATRVIIAHRPEFIKKATRVINIEFGKVVESDFTALV